MKTNRLFSLFLSEDSEQRTFRYFNIMYGIALFTVAFVSIASNVLVQYNISEQSNDSKIVNIAGRQRMLSQKIAKLALTENASELSATYNEWFSYHNGLKMRDEKLELQGENSLKIAALFEKMEPSFFHMKKGVEYTIQSIQNGNKSKLKEAQQLILDHEGIFLKGMDQIVFQYAEEAHLKVKRLKHIEIFLLIIVLLVLSLEAVLIFHPVGKKIKRVIADLVQSETKANKLADELKETYESLVRSNKEVHDINFALDAGTILIKTDKIGQILYANKRYSKVTKYSLGELKGKALFENNLGEEESVIYEHIRNPSKRMKMWQGEIYDHAKDYSYFWLDVTLIPIISITGELYQYLVICSNITKRKHTEAELQRINEERLRKQQHEQKIRSLSIVTGQEGERKRMAQEVHDGIGQMLTALKFGIESISSEDPKEQDKVNGLKELLQETIRETRRISSDLLPVVLRDYGLAPAIRELASKPQNIISIEFEDLHNIGHRLNKNIEISLYRICQEAINNSFKYSDASYISVQLSNTVEHLLLIIDDDGKGFDLNKAEEKNKTSESGNGLNNMRERAALINSNLYINTRPNKGTRIYVELPIENDIFINQ